MDYSTVKVQLVIAICDFDYHPNAHTIIHQLNIFPAWLENTRLYIDANE